METISDDSADVGDTMTRMRVRWSVAGVDVHDGPYFLARSFEENAIDAQDDIDCAT